MNLIANILFTVVLCQSGVLGYLVPAKLAPVYPPYFVSRADWGAKDPILIEDMPNPVSHVIIHHSYIPEACETPEGCVEKVREVQRMHMVDNGWNDIGYSFLVGGDGRAYFGRGWDRVGAHAPGYNNKSIGICVIGDWRYQLPPNRQMEVIHKVIAHGVENGMIAKDYTLLGHRQTRPTECPGQALYDEITTWSHFSPCPQPVDPSQQNNTTVCPDKVKN